MISIRLNGILWDTAVRLPQTPFKKLVMAPLLKYILPMLLLLSCLKRQNFKNVDFTIKGEISYQEAIKTFINFPIEDQKERFFVIEFSNLGNEDYFIETYKGVFCYVYKELYFDKNKEIIAGDTGGGIPAPDLCKIAPGLKKSFLCAPFSAGKESEEVEISFLLQGTKKDSKLIIRRKFKLKNGEIIF